jgi:RHS repeat-associated protein
LTGITRPDGQLLTFSYDSAGRISSLMIPDGAYTYAYQASSGKLASITAPDAGLLSYAYDGALLTGSTWAGSVAGSVTRAYNNNFRLSSLSVNGINPISFQYDNDNQLIAAGSLTLSRQTQNGLLSTTTLGSVADARNYNDFGEPTSYSATFNSAGIYAAQYSRDKLGRLTQKVETIGGVTDTYVYTYDSAGRLSLVEKNGVSSAAYTYDGNGNRLTFSGPGGPVNGTYDDQDRLLQYGATIYSYTANGELLSRTTGGQTTSYQYDVVGNLKSVTLPDNTEIEYLVDGRNRRIGKRVNGVLNQGFLYQDELSPIVELDGNNTVVSRFIYGSRSNVPDYLLKGGATFRIITDHLGSPRLIVDAATGTIAQRLDYDEFGNVLMDTNPGFQPFGFAGGLYDADTRLTRFGARDYDAQIGRWTAKDPVGFQGGTNLYSYVNNQPLNLIDPEGRFGVPPAPIDTSRILQSILNEIEERVNPGVKDPAGGTDGLGEAIPEDPHEVPTEPNRPMIGPRPLLPQWIPGEEPTQPNIIPPVLTTFLLICGALILVATGPI